MEFTVFVQGAFGALVPYEIPGTRFKRAKDAQRYLNSIVVGDLLCLFSCVHQKVDRLLLSCCVACPLLSSSIALTVIAAAGPTSRIHISSLRWHDFRASACTSWFPCVLPICPSVLPFDAVLANYCYPVVLPKSRLPADAAISHWCSSLVLLNLHIKYLL